MNWNSNVSSLGIKNWEILEVITFIQDYKKDL